MSQLLAYTAFLLIGFGLGGLVGAGLSIFYFKRKIDRMMSNPMQAAGEMMDGLIDDDIQDP
jgi:hypothetical protein